MRQNHIAVISYIGAAVLSNFIVLRYAQYGLIITALFIVPFDFVIRAYFHETWRGWQLFFRLSVLILSASLITFALNHKTMMIAIASFCAFLLAHTSASAFYQLMRKHTYLIKVNGSDIIGAVVDSTVFQLIAFGALSSTISVTQVLLKVLGGFLWYWIIFKKLQLHKKWI